MPYCVSWAYHFEGVVVFEVLSREQVFDVQDHVVFLTDPADEHVQALRADHQEEQLVELGLCSDHLLKLREEEASESALATVGTRGWT